MVGDILTRHDPDATIFLTALVAPANKPSRRCLERHGMVDRGPAPDAEDFLVHAALLDTVGRNLGISRTHAPPHVESHHH
ncbi:hypothetical protein ACWEF9_11105 [Streptomyces sp. NPDC004980]